MVVNIAALLWTLDDRALVQAQALLREGNYREAERLARSVWQVEDSPQPMRVQAANTLGVALYGLGRQQEAEQFLRIAASAFYQDSDADAMRALSNLGQVLASRGETDRAEPVLRRTLWWFTKFQPGDHQQLALEHHNLGSLYLQQWRHAEARQHLEIAASEWPDPASLNALMTASALGLLAVQEGKLAAADRQLAQVWHDVEQLGLPETHQLLNTVLLHRASLRVAQKRFTEARKLLEQSLRSLWHHTDVLPNELLLREMTLYRQVLKMAKDRESQKRVSRWATAVEHGHRKPAWNCSDGFYN